MTRTRYRYALALTLAACAANAAAEGVLAQLYAARPPAGSSFVRVVNPHVKPLQAQIAQGPAQEIGPDRQATTYAIVKGNQSFDVRIDGKLAGTLQVAPDTFNTLVPRRDGGRLSFSVIDDSSGAQDALKAELRFYNLAADCPAGQLSVSPSGPVLFKDVEPGASAARAINPVSATLAAGCGAAASPTLPLPALQPGDHYSLFLTGTPQAPVLHGQVSGTDPYKK
ncbi:alginate O-acetyltransferase AlgF [Achromobacter arsenitoxydans]|uniref:Alginate biosynthesis protein AlgF n=1 Tax=Achromobacter arsenitoxydans SY8 TaxID=477184 RepID=H0F5Q5_9BURK|nr:alginate O-acetyltransferase AlgF [Achromobacter arsenitoxydans]EHK66183.1 cell morphology protein [Achromobacter arsenitoxydans SY8]